MTTMTHTQLRNNLNDGGDPKFPYICPGCGQPSVWAKGNCIQCALDAVPWKEGDQVRIKSTGQVGTVYYRYYNGFTFVAIKGETVTGGMFNNDGTHHNCDLELVNQGDP